MTEGIKTLKQGEYLFLQGQEGHELYFLRSGVLEIILSPSKPNFTEEDANRCGQVIDRFDQSGQLVGEMSPILNCPRTASVRAAGECSLMTADMRPGAFENVMSKKPALGIKIAEELARRINKTNDRLKKEDLRLLRFLEETRLAFSSFWGTHAASINTCDAELSGNLFIALCNLSGCLNVLPADLPVSFALPYDKAGAFYSYFGGMAFTTSGSQTQAAGAADALAKVQGKKYTRGTVLCTNGEDAKELFILLQGKLDVVLGRRTIQSVEGRGNIIGEMAFLLKTRRTASVIAADHSTVLAVPYEKMEPLFSRVPSLLILMLKQLAGRLLQADTLLQKSTWRTLYFGELLPAFVQTIKTSADGLPASLDEAVRDAAQRTLAVIGEAVRAMSKATAADTPAAPLTLDELVASQSPQEVGVDTLSETPPGSNVHTEHVDFVLSLSDNRQVYGLPQTPRSKFAEYLNVDEKSLVLGRLVGKIGQSGTYAEILMDADGTDETRRKLVEQISKAVGVSHILLTNPPTRWLYQYEGGGSAGAVSADAIPPASQLLQPISKFDRDALTPLDKSRARRLYLEALTSVLEAHWSAPGQFTELTPAEFSLAQFGAVGDAAGDRLKLDVPQGRTGMSIVDFAKRVVVRLAGGEHAVMGGPAAAKAQLPEKEKQIAELVESRKKTYAELKVPYEDGREGPLMQQIEKMTQMQRLKEKGGLTGDALRDFAAVEKDMEKMIDERGAFVSQALKGDPGRKALTQIKGVEDQIRAAVRQKLDLVDAIQTPTTDAEKEKAGATLLPITLLNGFRDLLTDMYARIRQALQPENMDVAPILSEGVRLYGGRDVGIALQKIFEKDKTLPSGQDFPAILRLPGEGYAIYEAEWNVFAVPLYISVDPFQMMAHAVGEWRWTKVPESEQKKYQKAMKGGSSVRLDQLGIYFARDYRLLLDDKDVEEGSAKFIHGVMTAVPAAAPAAKAK